jgi:hypothetical protein
MPIGRPSFGLQSVVENYLRAISQNEPVFASALKNARRVRALSLRHAKDYSERLVPWPDEPVYVMDSVTAKHLDTSERLERESEMIAAMVVLAIDEDVRRLCRLTTELKPFVFQYGEKRAGSTTAELVWAAANSCRHAFEWDIAVIGNDTKALADSRFQRNQEILGRLLNTSTLIVYPCCYEALTALSSEDVDYDVCDIEVLSRRLRSVASELCASLPEGEEVYDEAFEEIETEKVYRESDFEFIRD